MATKDVNIFEGMQSNEEAKMVRHVCYLPKTQSSYIKEMAKAHGVKESEIFRMALDMIMKSNKFGK